MILAELGCTRVGITLVFFLLILLMFSTCQLSFPIYWDLFLYPLILLLSSLLHKVLLTLWGQNRATLWGFDSPESRLRKYGQKGYVHGSLLYPQRCITITWSNSQIYSWLRSSFFIFIFLFSLLFQWHCAICWVTSHAAFLSLVRNMLPDMDVQAVILRLTVPLLLPLMQDIYHYLHQYAFLLYFSKSLF